MPRRPDRSRAVRRPVLRTLAALGLLVGATLGPGGAADAEVPVVVIRGRGWGHGVGLSQHGARTMASRGRDWPAILATFYPGAELGSAGGMVRVSVHTAEEGATHVQLPGGGEIRSPLVGEQHPGFPLRVPPGGLVLVWWDEAWYGARLVPVGALGGHTTPFDPDGVPPLSTTTTGPGSTSTTTTIPGVSSTTTTSRPDGPTAPTTPGSTTSTTTSSTTTTAPPPSEPPEGPREVRSPVPLWVVPDGDGTTAVPARQRAYRGVVEVTASGGPLRLVNHLDVETYLRGLGEMPAEWPLEAHAAQVVAARTYALRAMAAGGELCDYDRCQVYVGATREHPVTDAAVEMTRGVVLTWGGRLISALYSASAGGVTALPSEAFGLPDAPHPYLRTVRYETDNPLVWESTIALSDVGRLLGYPGTVTSVSPGELGPSGRVTALRLDGTAGPVTVDGREAARVLRLRSLLYTTEVTTAAQAPPPPELPAFGEAAGGAPPVEVVLQAPPDDVTALWDAALAGDPTVDAPDPAPPVFEAAELAVAAGSSDAPGDPPVGAVGLAASLLVAVTTVAAAGTASAPAGAGGLSRGRSRR